MNDVKNKDFEMSNVDRDTITDLKDYMKALIDGLKIEMKSNNDYVKLEIENMKARLCALESKNQNEDETKSKTWNDIKMEITKWGITSFIVFILGLIWLWAKNGFPKIW